MSKSESKHRKLHFSIRWLGNKRSLPFIIFLSVVCLLVYLFAFYLFSVRGIINQFGLETHRQLLADNLALLEIEMRGSYENEIDLDRIQSAPDSTTKFLNLQTADVGSAFVYDSELKEVVYPPDFDAGLAAKVSTLMNTRDAWKTFPFGDNHNISIRDHADSDGYFQVARTTRGERYILGMVKDQLEVFARASGFERTLSGFLAMGFLVFLVFFIAIIKILTSPLRKISQAARDITQGDYNVRLKPDFAFISEVGELSRSFNEMSHELHKRYEESRAYAAKLKLSNVNLEDALNKLKQKYQELRNLNNISFQLHRMYDSDRIVNFALEHIRVTNELKRAAVYMKAESGGHYVELGSSGEIDTETPSEGSFDHCIKTATAVVESDLLTSTNGHNTRRLLIPIELGERTSGVLLIESNHIDDFDEERVDHFTHITSHIFSIVRNKLLLQDSLKRTEELRRINRISERISGELDLDRLFNEIARAVRASLGAAACAILTREPDGVLRQRSLVSVSKAAEALPFEGMSQGILKYIIDSQEPVLVEDAPNDERLEGKGVLVENNFRSFVGTPMFYQGGLIGIICAVDQAIAAFDNRDVSFLSTVGNQTATALENATLFEIVKERDSRRDQQLNVAQKFQRDRIPTYFEKGKIEIHAALSPAEELAGDFFDVFSLAPSTIAFVIGDVATKGIPASLMTFSLLSMFRKDAKTMRSPTKVLETVNQNVSVQVKEDSWFTTAFYGKLNTDDLTLIYAKAGHEMPILHRAETGEIFQLDANGLPLGIYENTQYEAKQVQLAHGDRVVMFTDGVVEAMDASGDRYGRRRLEALISLHTDLNAKELCDRIIEDVNAFLGGGKPQDDILVAVLEVKKDPWVHKRIRYSESADLMNSIIDQLKVYNLDNTTLYCVRLSLDESLANAFKHGNDHNDEAILDISFLITREKFCLMVRDAGRGFNYEALPDPTVEENLFKSTGRGVFLMRQLLDEVEFNEAGNEIHLVKYFQRPDEPEEIDDL